LLRQWVGSRRIVIETDSKLLVADVKDAVCRMLDLPVESFRLAIRGRVLAESASLKEEGVQEGEQYFLFPGGVGG
jgi:hypothetical protein